MTLVFAALLAQAAISKSPPRGNTVVHPHIPCWTGEGTGNAPGESGPSITVFSAADGEQPLRIEHGRDLILRGNAVEQDYNFIDYHFANEGRDLMARIYLHDPYSVSIRFPAATIPPDGVAARQMITTPVMCYLQKRFGTMEALTRDGYVPLWPGD